MPANAAALPREVEGGQYLRLKVGGVDFLLRSQRSVAIEQRDQLLPEASHPYVVAWKVVLAERWPVLHLGSDLTTRADGEWEKAVFIDAKPCPIGFTASNILLLPSEVAVEPFTPPGTAPTPVGHVFGGAWVQGVEVLLAFNADALVAHLKRLGGLS